MSAGCVDTALAYVAPFIPRCAALPQADRPLRVQRHAPQPVHAAPRPARRGAPVMRDRAFWVLPTTKDALTTALEASFTDFVFTDAALAEQCAQLARFSARVVDAETQTFPGGRFVMLHSPADVSALMAAADAGSLAAAPGDADGAAPVVIVHPTDWKAIPLENLIAKFQPLSARLFTVVDSAADASAMLGMLETGVDGCVLRAGASGAVGAYAALRSAHALSRGGGLGELTSAEVRGVRAVGSGERVCVDTAGLLSADEGLLVGSSSQALFLALSEAAEVAYVPSRPFRVNAGAVHSYCLVPGGATRYLCELRAGDAVLAVRAGRDGAVSIREVVVGRAKIETRPFLLVEAVTDGGKAVNVFVQNAETVRLATVDDAGLHGMTSVTELQPGDRVVLRTDEKARHVGMPIDENLVEV